MLDKGAEIPSEEIRQRWVASKRPRMEKAMIGAVKGGTRLTGEVVKFSWRTRLAHALALVGLSAGAGAYTGSQKDLEDYRADLAAGAGKVKNVLRVNDKMPSGVLFEKLITGENERIDFFDITFPWLNESEKLTVRSLVDNEKGFLRNTYPEGTDKRVYGWTPLIQKTAERYGVPFRYVRDMVFVESAGEADAYNEESGAAGLAQIMEETAVNLGYTPQDRYDPEKNLEMASIYLRDFHEQTGLWPEDIVIFHAGAGHWDFLKRTAFKNRGVAIPTVVAAENVVLNAEIQRAATFAHGIGPIHVELDKEVQDITKDKGWNEHGKYLLRVYAADEIMEEYIKSLTSQPTDTNATP